MTERKRKKGETLHEWHVTHRKTGPQHPMAFPTKGAAQRYMEEHPQDDLEITEVNIPEQDEE